MGSTILYADMMESTQNVVQRTISDVPEGFLCVTDKQSKEAVELSKWSSPPGCLLFTFVVRFPRYNGHESSFRKCCRSSSSFEIIIILNQHRYNISWDSRWSNPFEVSILVVKISIWIWNGRTISMQIREENWWCLVSILTVQTYVRSCDRCGSQRRQQWTVYVFERFVRILLKPRDATRGEVLGQFCTTFQEMLDVFRKRGFSRLNLPTIVSGYTPINKYVQLWTRTRTSK